MRALQLAVDWARENTNVILIAVLVLIIVGALALSVSSLIGGGFGGKPESGLHLWCQETGEAHALEPTDLPPGEADQLFAVGESSPKLTNPDTGRQTLVMMWRCPECEEYFLPEPLKDPTAKHVRPGNPSVPAVCPHCETDMHEWARRHGRG